MATTLICCSIPIDDAEDLPLSLDVPKTRGSRPAWSSSARRLAEDPEAASLVFRLLEESPSRGSSPVARPPKAQLYEDTTRLAARGDRHQTDRPSPSTSNSPSTSAAPTSGRRSGWWSITNARPGTQDRPDPLGHDFEGRPADLMRRVAALASHLLRRRQGGLAGAQPARQPRGVRHPPRPDPADDRPRQDPSGR